MKLTDLQKVFDALADPTRFRILSLLQEGELCVCDFMRVLKEPQSKVSRHLAYLRRSGVVEARKEGLWMYYRLAQPKLKTFRAVLKTPGHARHDFEELEKDFNEYKKKRGVLIACCQ
ncbi:MAG: hypothetical protein A2Z83_01555 [Omnitrophica bacterium GWA2_52_8]|nr:MAG: hypothetical protein A2Z83_01555 [Omnitrophica bacterium GWA2_52_8]